MAFLTDARADGRDFPDFTALITLGVLVSWRQRWPS